MAQEKELYTVQEIATMTGKTTQGIYAKLDNLTKNGKDYTITGTDGKKRVKRAFIIDFYGDIVTDQQEQEQTNTQQAVELAALKAKADEQEKQIEQLQSRIEAQQRTIEQLQQMNINNQLLLSQLTQNQTLLLQTTAEKDTDTDTDADADQQTESTKPSFWDRFKKKQ